LPWRSGAAPAGDRRARAGREVWMHARPGDGDLVTAFLDTGRSILIFGIGAAGRPYLATADDLPRPPPAGDRGL
jgi:hypothetical protein